MPNRLSATVAEAAPALRRAAAFAGWVAWGYAAVFVVSGVAVGVLGRLESSLPRTPFEGLGMGFAGTLLLSGVGYTLVDGPWRERRLGAFTLSGLLYAVTPLVPLPVLLFGGPLLLDTGRFALAVAAGVGFGRLSEAMRRGRERREMRPVPDLPR